MDVIMNSADTCSGEAARLAVYALASRKVVYRTNPGQKGTPAIYDLSPKENEDAIKF